MRGKQKESLRIAGGQKQMSQTHYVLGFLFRQSYVCLIEKKHGPKFMLGKFNGIGGKVDGEEFPVNAMRREFKEEAGMDIPVARWTHFCSFQDKEQRCYAVDCFKADWRKEDKEPMSMTDEPVLWTSVSSVLVSAWVPSSRFVPNLPWLLMLARTGVVFADVTELNQEVS